MATDKLLKPNEVADILGVKPATVRHWLRTAQIEGYRIHGRWRIRPSALHGYVADEARDGAKADCVAAGGGLRVVVSEARKLARTAASVEDVLAFLDRLAKACPEDRAAPAVDRPNDVIRFVATELDRVLRRVARPDMWPGAQDPARQR